MATNNALNNSSAPFTVTTGNLAVSAGNITVPNTNAGLTQGVITWASGPRMHNFGTDNIFIGASAGNGTLTGTDCVFIGANGGSALTSGTGNMGIGANCLSAVTSGGSNVGMGIATLHSITTQGNCTGIGHNSLNACTGGANTAIGYQSLNQVTSGTNNTAIGYQAGGNYTSSEANNICIGYQVTGTIAESNVIRLGNTSNTACYITGIDGVNVGSVAKVVTETSDKLGTATLTAGSNITITPTANTITIAASGGSSVTWTDQASSTTVTSGSGSFCTGTATLTLPASPSQGDVCSFAVDTTSILTIKGNTGQLIRTANNISASAGTLVNTLRGDAVSMVYRSTGTTWICTSMLGQWSLT